jgi:ubiquitin-protein ligase
LERQELGSLPTHTLGLYNTEQTMTTCFSTHGKVSEPAHKITHCSGMIIGPQGKPTGECIYTFTAFCSDSYPEEAPKIKFTGTKVAGMAAVDNHGNVNLSRLVPAFHWNPSHNIADALRAVRTNMIDNNVIQASYNVRDQNY